jgi:hypothetical protein
MLGLPWWVAPRDLKAGETVHIGREVDDSTRPHAVRVVTYTLAEDAPAGTILAAGPDRCLYRLTAANARQTLT